MTFEKAVEFARKHNITKPRYYRCSYCRSFIVSILDKSPEICPVCYKSSEFTNCTPK